MENGKDFIYEYSDLNLFQTRVQVLSGENKGMIVEYGTSGVLMNEDENVFNFDFTFYKLPDTYTGTKITVDEKMKQFLGNLLMDVIVSRRKDKNEKKKLMEAASVGGVIKTKIKIDSDFYIKGKK